MAHDASPDAASTRAVVAARIAAEVWHADRLGQTKLTKVTSLLHAFRVPDTLTRINDVKRVLEDVDIQLDTGWHSGARAPIIRRSGVLELSVTKGREVPPVAPDTDDSIQMSVWTSTTITDECAFPLQRDIAPQSADVRWFNIDPAPAPKSQPPDTHGWRAKVRPNEPPARAPSESTKLDGPGRDRIDQRAQEVTRKLEPWCEGLNEEMVRDLLDQDLQPKVETYGDEKDGVRGVSVVAAIARELPGGDDDSDGVSEELVFQLVEMVVGHGWIVSCWHPGPVYAGSGEARHGDPILREPFLSHVRHRWREQMGHQTSGDLGLYLARSLVNTYEASHRMMERWVESWEVDFYTSLGRSGKAGKLKESAGEISNFLSMAGEIRRRLTALEHARLTTSDKTWFPSVSEAKESSTEQPLKNTHVEALDEAIKSEKAKFIDLSNDIRADMDLLMLQSTATQQETSEKVQGYLGKVTGLVLVPTLVAGLFGANTRLPGGGTWMGFELMLVLMILSGIAVYLAIRKLTS